MRIPAFASALLLYLPFALATHLRLTIPSSPALPNPSILPPSTTASLTTLGTHLTAPLRLDNTFDFRNVSSGSYLLDIHCHTHVFRPLRVDVFNAGSLSTPEETVKERVEVFGTFRGNEWSNKGEGVEVTEWENAGAGKVWGFNVRVHGPKEYLVERSGFSPLSILKSPMILIAIASMGVVFGMPYLMENMDPEMRAEFEEQQKKSPLGGGGAAANPLQSFDAAAWLAGSGDKKKETPTAQGKITR